MAPQNKINVPNSKTVPYSNEVQLRDFLLWFCNELSVTFMGLMICHSSLGFLGRDTSLKSYKNLRLLSFTSLLQVSFLNKEVQ